VFTQIQNEILDSREQRGRTVVLILDEAQLLQVGPLQELRLMTNFKMDSHDPFVLILAGQSELKRIIDYAIMEPLAQRLRLRYHMPQLSQEETAAYVERLLQRAGAREPIFAPEALSAIHELTYGIPRRIGNMASQAMLYAMFDDKHTVDADMVLKVKTGA
jgi:type II secretory pathway predicted ATPase ExeA